MYIYIHVYIYMHMSKNILNQQQGKYNGLLPSIMWLGNSIRSSLAAHVVWGISIPLAPSRSVLTTG